MKTIDRPAGDEAIERERNRIKDESVQVTESNYRNYFLEACYAEAKIDGLVAEFGVWQGESLKRLAAMHKDTVHGFDSFEGLPEDCGAVKAGKFNEKGKVTFAVPGNVELHIGWFNETLPVFEYEGPAKLLHIDCDVYTSTVDILDRFERNIVPGTVLAFDELVTSWNGANEVSVAYDHHELKAWNEFVERTKIKYRYFSRTHMSQVGLVVT